MTMRLAFLAILGGGCLSAQASTIDLDAPGALRALEQENPAHHARVARLVGAAEREPCHGDQFERLRVAIAAKSVECSLIVRTSNPPRQRMTFALDGAVYTIVVVLHHVQRPRSP
jgi:hypothetical protein